MRGFAVLGILVMNIQSFSMIGTAYMNPYAYGDMTGLSFSPTVSNPVTSPHGAVRPHENEHRYGQVFW